MNKLPWFKFFPADWIKETRILSAEEKGIWIDLLAYMWESPTRGKIVSDWESIGKMIGVPWLDIATIVTRMKWKNVLDLTEANKIITLKCRRMERDETSRKNNRIRQLRHYRKQKSNAYLTLKKSEVRSQIKDSIEPSVQKPVNSETSKKLTDIQKIITIFKLASHFERDDKTWDKMYFSRYAKSAKSLLEFFGNWKDAGNCIQDVYEKLTAKGLTVTMETICKHAADWKKDHQEKGGLGNGVLSNPSHGNLST